MSWLDPNMTPEESDEIARKNGENPGSLFNPSLYSDYNGDFMRYLSDMADKGDSAAIDKLLNYLMSEESADRARKWTADREDTAFQRLFKDISATGVNPLTILQAGGNPITSSSSGNSFGGTQFTTRENNKATNNRAVLTAFIAALGTILMAAAVAA